MKIISDEPLVGMNTIPHWEPGLYESPIESDVAWLLCKRLDREARLIPQFRVKTAAGNFRLDFMVERHGRRIGIECDGKEFHDEVRDRERDYHILASGAVAAIYRMPGAGIVYHLDDLVFFLTHYEPNMFSERGRLNCRALASADAKSDRAVICDILASVDYIDEESDEPTGYSVTLKVRSAA